MEIAAAINRLRTMKILGEGGAREEGMEGVEVDKFGRTKIQFP